MYAKLLNCLTQIVEFKALSGKDVQFGIKCTSTAVLRPVAFSPQKIPRNLSAMCPHALRERAHTRRPPQHFHPLAGIFFRTKDNHLVLIDILISKGQMYIKFALARAKRRWPREVSGSKRPLSFPHPLTHIHKVTHAHSTHTDKPASKYTCIYTYTYQCTYAYTWALSRACLFVDQITLTGPKNEFINER